MRTLKRLVEEIRNLEGIEPGQPMPENSDYGEMGQMLENLLYNDPYWWDKVEADEELLACVIGTARYYRDRIRERRERAAAGR